MGDARDDSHVNTNIVTVDPPNMVCRRELFEVEMGIV